MATKCQGGEGRGGQGRCGAHFPSLSASGKVPEGKAGAVMPTTMWHREPRVWRPDADPCDFKPLSSFSESQFPLICDKGPYCVKQAIVTVLRVKQVGAWGLPSPHPSQKPSRCPQGPQGSVELRVLKSPSPLFTLPPCHLASPQRNSQVEAPLWPVAFYSLRHCPLTPAE